MYAVLPCERSFLQFRVWNAWVLMCTPPHEEVKKKNYLILHVPLYLMMAYIEVILSLRTVNSQRLAKKLTQWVISCLPKEKKSKRKKFAAGEPQKEQPTLWSTHRDLFIVASEWKFHVWSRSSSWTRYTNYTHREFHTVSNVLNLSCSQHGSFCILVEKEGELTSCN